MNKWFFISSMESLSFSSTAKQPSMNCSKYPDSSMVENSCLTSSAQAFRNFLLILSSVGSEESKL